MKTETKRMEPQILLEEYHRILEEEEEVAALPLTVTGNSMSPFLIHGRDTVYLSRLTRPPRRGDILLYRRSTGGYVLHRVYAVKKDGLTMVGDAQTALEPGIQERQVLAVVTAVLRKDIKLEPGSFWWMFFEKIWIRLLPVRKPIRWTYNRFRQLFG